MPVAVPERRTGRGAPQGALPTEGERAIAALLSAVRQLDSNDAVAARNAGLARSTPEVRTRVGALFVAGVGFKPSREHALNFCQVITKHLRELDLRELAERVWRRCTPPAAVPAVWRVQAEPAVKRGR